MLKNSIYGRLSHRCAPKLVGVAHLRNDVRGAVARGSAAISIRAGPIGRNPIDVARSQLRLNGAFEAPVARPRQRDQLAMRELRKIREFSDHITRLQDNYPLSAGRLPVTPGSLARARVKPALMVHSTAPRSTYAELKPF